MASVFSAVVKGVIRSWSKSQLGTGQDALLRCVALGEIGSYALLLRRAAWYRSAEDLNSLARGTPSLPSFSLPCLFRTTRNAARCSLREHWSNAIIQNIYLWYPKTTSNNYFHHPKQCWFQQHIQKVISWDSPWSGPRPCSPRCLNLTQMAMDIRKPFKTSTFIIPNNFCFNNMAKKSSLGLPLVRS